MTSYRVRWEIDVEAETPAEAACKARVFATKEDTTATCYEVFAEEARGWRATKPVSEFDVRWSPSFPYAKAYTVAEAEALDAGEGEEITGMMEG